MLFHKGITTGILLVGVTYTLPSIADVRSVPAYPVLAPGQQSFTVPLSDAELTIENLYFPAGLNIQLDPAITAIKWTVRTIKIDSGNATLDMSAPATPAGTGATGPGSGQADYCTVGAKGTTGGKGQTGRASVPLTITGVRQVNTLGSLWIKFDGGPGGDGGQGGKGQTGGGNRHTTFGGCGFATGGPGGDGGPPGGGGDVSLVSIFMESAPAVNVLNPSVDRDHCRPSYVEQRPSGAQPTSGVIVASGEPGCPGQKGPQGGVGAEGAPRPH